MTCGSYSISFVPHMLVCGALTFTCRRPSPSAPPSFSSLHSLTQLTLTDLHIFALSAYVHALAYTYLLSVNTHYLHSLTCTYLLQVYCDVQYIHGKPPTNTCIRIVAAFGSGLEHHGCVLREILFWGWRQRAHYKDGHGVSFDTGSPPKPCKILQTK